MMLGFFEHLLTLPFRYFHQRTTGDVLMRLGSNAIIREILTRQTLSSILDGLLLLTYLALLLPVAPLHGAVAFRLWLLWVGALRVLDGAMSLGTMLALNALAISFLTPLASLVSSGQQFQLVGAHLDRLTDVLEAEPEQDLERVQHAPPLTGRIELKHVS